MRILVLADIHANYRALQATLSVGGDIDEVWCLGDLVSCGPSPEECIALVRSACRYVVRGNHDVGADLSGGISAESRAYLDSLPDSILLTRDGCTCCLVHGSPANPIDGAIWPSMSTESVRASLGDCTAQCVLAGHTHMAIHLTAGAQLVVNPGTVGQPRDGDYRAQCALIEEGKWRFVRVAYDLHALAQDYARSTAMRGPDKDKWLRATCRGIVEEHGLQRGPFTDAK